MYIFSFEKLEVWKESKSLCKKTYTLTEEFPSSEKFGLTSQLRRDIYKTTNILYALRKAQLNS